MSKHYLLTMCSCKERVPVYGPGQWPPRCENCGGHCPLSETRVHYDWLRSEYRRKKASWLWLLATLALALCATLLYRI